jgi:RNA polymerase sigma factor (sigma-70 family)
MMAQKKIRRETATCAAELDLANYFRLARSLAWKYARVLGSIDDATSVALIGLVQAAQLWKPDEGSFGMYAAIAMRHSLRRHAEREQRRNGVARQDRILRHAYFAARPQQAHSFRLVPIDAPVTPDSADTIGDMLADSDTLDPEAALIEKDEAAAARRRVADAMSVLDARERYIVIRRFDDEPPTLDVLADEFGVSRERVRQIEEKALARLKLALTGRAQRRKSPPKPKPSLASPPTTAELDRLDPRERRIAAARILADEPTATLGALASELGLSPARVCQIETDVRQKLAEPAGAA